MWHRSDMTHECVSKGKKHEFRYSQTRFRYVWAVKAVFGSRALKQISSKLFIIVQHKFVTTCQSNLLLYLIMKVKLFSKLCFFFMFQSVWLPWKCQVTYFIYYLVFWTLNFDFYMHIAPWKQTCVRDEFTLYQNYGDTTTSLHILSLCPDPNL